MEEAMDGKGNLLLEFTDVAGSQPDDRADVLLSHTVLSHTVSIKDARTAKRLKINDLDSTQGGTYRLQVFPLRRRAVGRFVRITEGQTATLKLMLPLKPERVSDVQFPDYAALGNDLQLVLTASLVEGQGNLQGEALYGGLDKFQRAGLLNLYAKMKVTKFADGDDVFSFVTSLKRMRGDRFFAVVNSALRDEVKNSMAGNLFHEVPGALHAPPPEYVPVDSFKTADLYGNLQLTFFNKPNTLEFIVDADIDDAQGVEHVFQVLDHTFTGGETNPFDIHEILMGYQQLNPGYDLIA
jgi:hypothetical protein